MEKLYNFIAQHLPKRIIYFALIRAWSNATTGEYSDQEIPAVTMVEVIDRW